MKEELNHLIELQAIDLQIQAMDQELAGGIADLESRQAETATKKEKSEAYSTKITDGEQRRRELEAAMEDELVHLKDRQTKLMNVQTNKEYQSLLKEIEDSKKQNKEREEEVVHLMEQAEELLQKITELNNVIKAEEDLLAEEEEKVSKDTKKVTTKKKKVEKSRTTRANKVSDSIRRRYDQLRERRNGLAVVGVTNGVCMGCYMSLPPQQFNEVLRGDQLHTCPTCQRMVYHLPPAEDN